MSNNISLHKVYLKSLDEIYKQKCLTSVLDTEEIDSTREAKTFTVDKLEMDGLSDYSRANGYSNGDVTLTQEEKSPNYDRGKKFSVDEMDDVESGYIAFGKLSGEFERTKVVPEIDAFRFAKYAIKAGNGAYGTISSGSDAVSAVETAEATLANKEVPLDNTFIFMTPEFYNLLRAGAINRWSDANGDKVNRKLVEFDDMKVVKVPGGRFFSKCTLSSNGYTNAGVKMNFLIVEKSAVMQFQKHKASNVINPEDNQSADAYILKYRNYGLADVYDNKVDGIYVHASRQIVVATVKPKTEAGADLAGTTIVVKKNTSSGAEISAESDGTYKVPADVNAIYISIAKNGYTTKTDTVTLTGVDNITGAVTIEETVVASES